MSVPEYDLVADYNRRIPMEDGATLSADVYLPARDGRVADGRFPCILHRTIHNRSGVGSNLDHDFFVRRGYAVVIESVRGRFSSDGEFHHGIKEMEDGRDTVEWIATQPWSSGKVGMTGISYSAAVQCATAIGNPPHLSAIHHVKAPLNYYKDHSRRGGAMCLYLVGDTLNFGAASREAQEDPAVAESLGRAFENSAQWILRWPMKKGLNPLTPSPDNEKWLLDNMQHTDYDGFWKLVPLLQPIEYLDKYADVPGYYVGSWYDTYQEDLLYAALRQRKSRPLRLLMGPWTHMNFERTSGDVDFGADAGLTKEQYCELQLGWFDQTLKGVDSGALKEPPVKIFVMGGGSGRKTAEGKMDHGGRWRYEDEWPIARTRQTPYYFHSDGTLGPEKSAEDESSTTYAYDPKDPVPTIGSTFFFMRKKAPTAGASHSGAMGVSASQREQFVPYGAYDQREDPKYFGCKTDLPLASRHDVIVFQTPPLAADVEVTGPIAVNIWASSSAVDTDFTAKLVDVHPRNIDYPDGYAMGLTNSILRACYRNGFERRELMDPGRPYSFTIELPGVSNLFKKGHRIRVDISSSNFPDFDVNPNTGDPYTQGGRTRIADNTIYHSAERASHVLLPVVPE